MSLNKISSLTQNIDTIQYQNYVSSGQQVGGNMDNLKITTNNLFDIIQYLKDGNMVCLHTRNNYIYFHFPNSINEKLIYIDISSMPSLMDEEEWPWYIINFLSYAAKKPEIIRRKKFYRRRTF